MSHLVEALAALSGERWDVAAAPAHIGPVPGLYAIYAPAAARSELGVSTSYAGPLYVGKSEDNLVKRDLRTHFAADVGSMPTTGSSTVRRSFAALLRDVLDLTAVPRNLQNPGYFSQYGLAEGGDERLSSWMRLHLSIAVWEKPHGLRGGETLTSIESAVIRKWHPPINLAGNVLPQEGLRSARAAMAHEARSWQQEAPRRPYGSSQGAFGPPEGRQAQVGRDSELRRLGPTPVELAHELGVSAKHVRDQLRAGYGTLPTPGMRWGPLSAEQEQQVRSRVRRR